MNQSNKHPTGLNRLWRTSVLSHKEQGFLGDQNGPPAGPLVFERENE
jgi:hypothetical protein